MPIVVGNGRGEARLHHLLKVLYISRANQVGCLRLTIAPSKARSELALSPASASENNPTLVIEYWEVSHTFLTPISPKMAVAVPQP